jgi:hypothetical protein
MAFQIENKLQHNSSPKSNMFIVCVELLLTLVHWCVFNENEVRTNICTVE